MLQKIMGAFVPPNKMTDMFTYKLEFNQSIEKIVAKVQKECDKNKFALLQIYNYHEIVESKGFPIKRKIFIYEICQASKGFCNWNIRNFSGKHFGAAFKGKLSPFS